MNDCDEIAKILTSIVKSSKAKNYLLPITYYLLPITYS